MSFRKIPSLIAAATVLAGCANGNDTTTDDGQTPDFRDGSYYYVLGFDPDSGTQIRGGAHDVVTFDENGKREAIDSANRTNRLHPALTEGSEYHVYDENLREGATDWPVFASTWWPQSRNGVAWRWQPGASEDYNDRSDTDRLSPLEKYDLLFYPGQETTVEAVSHCEYRDYVEDPENCERIDHPELTVAGPATAWELENQGVYQFVEPENWWGHCNGWASYATAEPMGFPQRDVRVRMDGNNVVECGDDDTEGCVLFRMADIEGLMTELYFSDQATFSGRRCNTTPDEIERDELGRPTDVACRDLNPGSFHVAITGLMGRGADEIVPGAEADFPAFVIDHNWDHEIWNFPVVGFQINEAADVSAEEAQELVGGEGAYQFNANATRFVRVQLTYQMISDSVPAQELMRRADTRDMPPVDVDLNYVLELNDAGRILGGEWIENPSFTWQDSKELHPDFMWKALVARGYGEGNDDLGGDDDNPFVAYSRVQSILRCANEPETCNDDRDGGEIVVAQDITGSVGRDEMQRFDDTLAPGTWTFTLAHDPANPGGDADLYVRVGSAPTLSAYDCRPWLNGSAETCTIELSEPTEVHWMIHGYGNANAFRLLVEGEVGGEGGGGEPPPAWGGMTESGTVAQNVEQRFTTGTVPEGHYVFEMTGTGDADLYVRTGGEPSTSTWDCRPYSGGSNETCEVNLASDGEIFVMVRGYAASSTYQLVGSAQ